jgi:hypothetical protein
MLAIAVLLASVSTGRSQEFIGTPPPLPATQGCNHCGHHFSLSRLWSWMTYRPLRVPRPGECRICQLTPTPPLYMYFIGEYGPRSPSLGFPVRDQGFAFAGPDHYEHCSH